MIWDNIDTVFEEVDINKEDYSPWEETPVNFRTFNESPDYLDAFSLSDRQYEDVENVLGDTPEETFSASRAYDLAVYVWGKGSGKDLVISRLFTYLVYILLCMKEPQKYLWLADITTKMDLVNVARKGEQAREIFFSYFTNTIKKAPWFRNHFIIRESGKIFSRPTGSSNKGNIEIGGSKVEFPKNIKAYAETSAFEGYEGFNVVAWVADEMSGFKSKTEQINAIGIYNTLRTSGSSRATKHFKHHGFIISYPRQLEGDLTLQKYYESFSNTHIYGSFGWQWHIKPAHLYSGATFTFKHDRIGRMFLGMEGITAGIEIPVELQQDFIEDPTDAMCKHLCVPPHTIDQWAEYPDIFFNSLIPQDDIFETEDYLADYLNNDTGVYEKRIRKKFIKLHLDNRTAKTLKFVAWLDAAETMCDACIGIGHIEVRNGVDMIIQDSNLVWTPDPVKNIKISLKNVEEWLTNTLPNNINLVAIGSDYWNSSGMAEVLREKFPNIRSTQSNLSEGDYNLAKKFVYTNQVIFRSATVVNQLVQLRRSVTVPRQPEGGRKDQADGFVGVVKLLKGVDAQKAIGMTSAPITVNSPEVKQQQQQNLFTAKGPMTNQLPYEHQILPSKDFRAQLGVNHKPWNSTKGNDSVDKQTLRFPQSTTF